MRVVDERCTSTVIVCMSGQQRSSVRVKPHEPSTIVRGAVEPSPNGPALAMHDTQASTAALILGVQTHLKT